MLSAKDVPVLELRLRKLRRTVFDGSEDRQDRVGRLIHRCKARLMPTWEARALKFQQVIDERRLFRWL